MTAPHYPHRPPPRYVPARRGRFWYVSDSRGGSAFGGRYLTEHDARSRCDRLNQDLLEIARFKGC